MLLVPSQEKPSGQRSHRERVLLSPPDVNEPAGHALQPSAPSPLNWSSLPHAVQLLAPTLLWWPAGQGRQSLSSSWLLLSEMSCGLWRPAGHLKQDGWFDRELYSPSPHTSHAAHVGYWQSARGIPMQPDAPPLGQQSNSWVLGL